MKTVLVLVCGLFFLSAPNYGQNVKILTYNIKYDNVNDTVNNWNDRKMAMAHQIKKHGPSFVGMQEVLLSQLNYLANALADFDYIGVGRDDGKDKGEFSPIFYNSKKYKLLNLGTFWLSKMPDTVSKGWDAALERICTYGLFEDMKSKKQIWVFNTHFDHRGVMARKKSATLILKKIKKINSDNLPVILMGDFNLTPNEKPISLIKKVLKDSKEISKSTAEGPVGTFNGFNLSDPIGNRIDYIFVKGFEVETYEHLNERLENGKFISDHLPVLISVK